VTKIINKIKEMGGLDLRSIALFRMAVAVCLIGDFWMRASDLVAHYTDSGVLTRSFFLEGYLNDWNFSLHFLSGRWQIQAILFGLSFVFALMLLVGYRTRLAVFFSWLLLVSVQIRNPLVLQGGDVLFRMVLFWSLFLPLGACYSVDSAMASNQPSEKKLTFSMATVAFILQVAFMYWFTAANKLSGESKAYWWDEGTAASIALGADQFARPFGHYLVGFPEVLKLITYSTILLQIFGPFLFFMPFRTALFRFLGVLAFLAFHMSIALCMLIGPFTWISCISLFPMLPGLFWDRMESLAGFGRRKSLVVYYDKECDVCLKMTKLLRVFCFLPKESIRSVSEEASRISTEGHSEKSWSVVDASGVAWRKFDAVIVLLKHSVLFYPIALLFSCAPLRKVGEFICSIAGRHHSFVSKAASNVSIRPVKTQLSLFGNVAAAVVLIYVLSWNLGGLNPKLGVPAKWQGVGYALGLDQIWSMFAPPGTDDGWYVIPGKLRDGTEVDLFKAGAPVEFSKPKYIYRTYKNPRWNKYLYNIRTKFFLTAGEYYARYLCTDWNAHHPPDQWLDELKILFLRSAKTPLMTPVVRKSLIWRYYCFEVPNPLPPLDPEYT